MEIATPSVNDLEECRYLLTAEVKCFVVALPESWQMIDECEIFGVQ